MKFSIFLINRIEELRKELGLRYVTITNKNLEVKKRVKQLYKLTPFLTSNRVSDRIYALEYKLKGFRNCEICGKPTKKLETILVVINVVL